MINPSEPCLEVRQCVYCGSCSRLVLDHFIPRSFSGTDDQCVVACHSCNIRKSNKHPRDWYLHQPFYQEERWQAVLASLSMTEVEIDVAMSAIANSGRMACKLPELMKAKKVDQKTVAAATGLSPTTVGKLYRSHFDRIDNHTVTQLCKYFGLRKLDELLELIWEEGDT